METINVLLCYVASSLDLLQKEQYDYPNLALTEFLDNKAAEGRIIKFNGREVDIEPFHNNGEETYLYGKIANSKFFPLEKVMEEECCIDIDPFGLRLRSFHDKGDIREASRLNNRVLYVTDATFEYVDENFEKKKEVKTMSTETTTIANIGTNMILPNFNFGFVSDDSIKMSFSGLAIKNNEGKYFSYSNGSVTDVTGMILEMPNAIFSMPVAIKKIAVGDYINHQGAVLVVKEVMTNQLKCIDVASSSIIEVMPVKNAFGFNYYTKYISFFGKMFTGVNECDQPNEDNPFGGMMKMMMIQSFMGGGSMFGNSDNVFGQMMQMKMMGSMFGGSDNFLDFDMF